MSFFYIYIYLRENILGEPKLNVFEPLLIVSILIMIVNLAISILGFIILRNFPKILAAVFIDPNFKKAMTILGKQSGAVRLDKANVRKLNENMGELSPMLAMIAEQLDMEPYDLLKMAGDLQDLPVIGDMIKKGVQSFQEQMAGGINKSLNKSDKNNSSALNPA